MKETCEVFGEVIEGETREELRDKVSAKLASLIDKPREIERARIAAKLAAKQRL